MNLRTATCSLAMFCACGASAAGQAHEHGTVKLDVAVEAAEVTIDVEMPLDSLVGFERAPRTDAERKTAAAALAKMRDGAALFRLDAAAQCTLAGARLDAPVLEQAPPPRGEEHADLDASYTFKCAKPARLGALEVLLFDAFRRIQRIEVQAVLPHGQAKAVLQRSARTVRLTR